ncbi:BTB/POZ domain-containing protein 9 isoform X1 [Ochotona princeps]|uniref:BTB/POZ domain-containing protein 9 isoform X1 n=1 Tax=Ochotona princeps TaxID=9978 RepID=UPI0027152C8B|nr:BTB/POZ domain-containing protein 9 isoform X1 [Ochotona princeps]
MSNSHPLRPFTAVGEIDHVHILSEHIGALLIGEEYGDVTFVVEKKRFPAHRVILAARCQYFRALLYGGMRESQPEAEIPLQDTTAEAFTMLLKYIYTGRATLTDEKEEVLLDFLSLAHKYGFPELEDSTSEYLCTILNIQNVCMTFDVASLYSLPKLTCMCCMFMDRNAQEVLSSEGFLSLSKTALLNIVLRDSFAAPEKDIFLALLNWCKHNSKENHAEIMQAVRLPLMSLTELLNVVRPSGLLSPDAILDAIKVRSESRDMDLNYRGMLIPEENIATMKYGAQVVKGELKSALLDGDTQNYDLDHGFSRHPIDDDCRSGIEIKLGQPSIINHIRILLWDRDSRSYSYFIEVSMDELDWIRVIDHSQYLCRSWQKLYFPARVCRAEVSLAFWGNGFCALPVFPHNSKQSLPAVGCTQEVGAGMPFVLIQAVPDICTRYIRIVGTHNTVNKIFHIVAFECMFTNKTFTLEKGLIVPTENVATIADCASVIEGVSRSRNALLNGDTKNYDWDSGYTCHQLGSGAIVVQLAQPYMIGSIRLLLWDCDDRSYSYYVEVSTNQQQWTMVADKTKVACKSWQSVTFDRQPASFIRIVGTHNTANEVFHCVHFECPEQQSSQKEESSEEPGTGDSNPAGQQLDPHALRAPSGSSLPPSPGNSHSPNRQHQ